MIDLNNRILELTVDDFLAAFELFESEGKEYPVSRFYDIFYNGESYPPKPILALAYKNRFSEKISTKELNQGKGSLEFKVIENLGFKLIKKFAQVMVYEVKSSASQNAIELTDYTNGFFYWNDLKFQKLKIGDFVFVVDRKNNNVLFTTLDNIDIPIKSSDQNFTYLEDLGQKYKVSGIYEKFVRLKILQKLNPEPKWEWKSFGSSQNAYLYGSNINIDSRDNRILNLDQLQTLSDDSLYQKVIDDCRIGFNQNVNSFIPLPEIKAALATQEIQNLCNEVDFHFEKARILFEQIKLHNEQSDFYRNLLGEFLNSELNFSDFFKSLKPESKEYEFIHLVEKLTAYIDYNAANKKKLNKYPDFRVIARTGVNQSLWLRGFLNFKILKNNPEKLPKNTGTVFKYLNNPGSELTMLSPVHRKRVSKYILNQTSYNEDTFVQDLIQYFKKYSFLVTNSENFTRIISEVLYIFPNVNKIWNPEDSTQGQKRVNFIEEFTESSKALNLFFPTYLIKRFIASLATKPFVIFTGLSGSGKTKLAQTFAKWICKDESQYKIIPVGADWTNREPLLGYPNSLDDKNYVLPDNGALTLLIEAIENAKNKEIQDCDPYFLILDEMNLSHVERYFADFLSTMESKDEIKLYSGSIRNSSDGKIIPQGIKLPPNLFIVGTVNIDETTYMFSPKVLDRANTIEFRIDEDDLASFFNTSINENPKSIDGLGCAFTKEFMKLADNEYDVTSKDASALLSFFEELQKLGAEFGYRTANEMKRLIHHLDRLGLDATKKESALDVAVIQKMLPKLNGSRSKLSKVLPILASFCIKDKDVEKAKQLLETFKIERKLNEKQYAELTLPLSFIKIARMYTNAIENGFASYAEG